MWKLRSPAGLATSLERSSRQVESLAPETTNVPLALLPPRLFSFFSV